MRKVLLLILFFISLLFSWSQTFNVNVKDINSFQQNYLIVSTDTNIYFVNKQTSNILATFNINKITGKVFTDSMYAYVPIHNGFIKLYFINNKLNSKQYDLSNFISGDIHFILVHSNTYFIFLNNSYVVLNYNPAFGTFNLITNTTLTMGFDLVGFTKRNTPYILSKDHLILLDNNYKPIILNIKEINYHSIVSTQDSVYVGTNFGKIIKYSYTGHMKNTMILPGSIVGLFDAGPSIFVFTSKGLYSVSKSLDKSTLIDPIHFGFIHYTYSYDKYVLVSDFYVYVSSTYGIIGKMPISTYNVAYSDGNSLYLSNKNRIESYSFENICAINSPEDYTIIGNKLLKIQGRSNKNKVVYISINKGESIKTSKSGNGWYYELDPSIYPSGLIEISCRVGDHVSDTIHLTKINNFKLDQLFVKFKSNIKKGDRVMFSLYDKDNNPISDFWVSVNGKDKKHIYSSTFSYTFKDAGKYTIVFSKQGYLDKSIVINVEGGIPLLLVGLFVVLLLLILIAAKFFHLF